MLIPCGHRVIVKLDVVEEVTSGGIIIGKSSAEQLEEAGLYGTLIAVGPTAWKDHGSKPWAEVGDRVAVSKYSGLTMMEPGSSTKFRLANDEDILVVLRPGEQPMP